MSGFSYKQWKGTFYPEKLKDADMLSFYGRRFQGVEINNTFYRMPKRDLLEKWADDVPGGFRFVLKASRRITHVGRLKNSDDSVGYLYSVAEGLGDKLGPVLFQLPPYMKKNLERLRTFLDALPAGRRIAIETRNPTWEDEEVRGLVESSGHVLVTVDREEEMEPDAEPPARVLAEIRAGTQWGYLRLRRCDYSDEDLTFFVRQIQSRGWDEAYVFFKHEDDGSGPAIAQRFVEIFQGAAA